MKLGIKRVQDTLHVSVRGDISEHSESEFEDLLLKVELPKLIFDLEKLELVNSLGTRVWIQVNEQLRKKNIEIKYQRCSVAFVECCNMYPKFAPSKNILSFFVNRVCESCQRINTELMEAKDIQNDASLSQGKCSDCNGNTIPQIDGFEYLQFLREEN